VHSITATHDCDDEVALLSVDLPVLTLSACHHECASQTAEDAPLLKLGPFDSDN